MNNNEEYDIIYNSESVKNSLETLERLKTNYNIEVNKILNVLNKIYSLSSINYSVIEQINQSGLKSKIITSQRNYNRLIKSLNKTITLFEELDKGEGKNNIKSKLVARRIIGASSNVSLSEITPTISEIDQNKKSPFVPNISNNKTASLISKKNYVPGTNTFKNGANKSPTIEHISNLANGKTATLIDKTPATRPLETAISSEAATKTIDDTEKMAKVATLIRPASKKNIDTTSVIDEAETRTTKYE